MFCALGCGFQRMDNQPKAEPLEESPFFADGQTARQPVPGTIPRGFAAADDYTWDEHYLTGLADGEVAEQLPPSLLERWDPPRLLRRGRERFQIYCVPCHGLLGDGQGRVAQRGFPYPPSFHIPALRDQPVGHFYRVITDGKGKMPEYGKQIPPDDRWAIAAYVQALQLSQHAEASDVPPDVWQQIQRLPE